MFLKIFFTLLLFCAFCTLSHHQREGFSIQKIRATADFNPAWEVESALSEDELRAIFKQPFYYLGKGAQTYVFASQDGKYVIKFFRYLNKYATPLEIFPLEKVQKTAAKRKGKLQKDFNSYKMAFDLLKEETGLVFLHLNQSKNLKTSITLYDKIKFQYKLSLDEMGFILQKKAAPFYPTLTKWIEENKTEEAKRALSALVRLISKRCSMGLFDKDPNLATNFGFLEERPIQFDIGRFKIDETRKNSQTVQEDLARTFRRLQLWLDQRAPELATHLKNEIIQAPN